MTPAPHPASWCSARRRPPSPRARPTARRSGKTTGFQTSITGSKSPFVVPFRGRVVAWSIKTGAPSTKPNPNNNNQSDYDFFSKTFGGTPKARIAVLKPIMKSIKAGQADLQAQVPVAGRGPRGLPRADHHLHPRHAAAGQAQQRRGADRPDLGARRSRSTRAPTPSWQASRKKGKCNDTADILAGTPQDALGTERAYGCTYNTARLLYSATVVADPNQAPAKPPKKKK